MYSRFRVSGPVHTRTAEPHVLIAIGIPVSGCSVQCANRTRQLETAVCKAEGRVYVNTHCC